MNRLPSPFQGDLPCVLNSSTPNSNSSPGFLMMTRPPSASSVDRGQYIGRGNFRSNSYNRTQTPYSSNGKTFTPNRNQNKHWYHNNRGNRSFNNTQTPPFYGNRSNNQEINSSSSGNYSNRNYSSGNNNQQTNSSPNFSGNNNSKGRMYQNRSLFNNSAQRNPKGPLKDIPIDKFISRNMINNPWVEFDFENDKSIDLLESKDENINDGDCVPNADERNSATDSPSTIESPNGSPSTPFTFSEKDTETEESDNASEY